MSERDVGSTLRPGVRESIEYLETGGIGEVIGLTATALAMGSPKIQSDTGMAMALCLLASEAIKARKEPGQ